MKAEATVNGRRTEGELVKENTKTVLMRLPDGETIKRHKEKHSVKLS